CQPCQHEPAQRRRHQTEALLDVVGPQLFQRSHLLAARPPAPVLFAPRQARALAHHLERPRKAVPDERCPEDAVTRDDPPPTLPSGAVIRSRPCSMSSARSFSSAATCSPRDSPLQSSSRHGRRASSNTTWSGRERPSQKNAVRKTS